MSGKPKDDPAPISITAGNVPKAPSGCAQAFACLAPFLNAGIAVGSAAAGAAMDSLIQNSKLSRTDKEVLASLTSTQIQTLTTLTTTAITEVQLATTLSPNLQAAQGLVTTGADIALALAPKSDATTVISAIGAEAKAALPAPVSGAPISAPIISATMFLNNTKLIIDAAKASGAATVDLTNSNSLNVIPDKDVKTAVMKAIKESALTPDQKKALSKHPDAFGQVLLQTHNDNIAAAKAAAATATIADAVAVSTMLDSVTTGEAKDAPTHQSTDVQHVDVNVMGDATGAHHDELSA